MKSRSIETASGKDVEATVAKVVALTLGKDRRRLGPEESVLAIRDHVDSFALLELVLRLEEAFGIRIEDDELDPDYFESVRTIADFISSKRRQA